MVEVTGRAESKGGMRVKEALVTALDQVGVLGEGDRRHLGHGHA